MKEAEDAKKVTAFYCTNQKVESVEERMWFVELFLSDELRVKRRWYSLMIWKCLLITEWAVVYVLFRICVLYFADNCLGKSELKRKIERTDIAVKDVL